MLGRAPRQRAAGTCSQMGARAERVQGQFGPQRVQWLEPSTSSRIKNLAAAGVSELVMVPVSFVFEHMGTVNEMDRE